MLEATRIRGIDMMRGLVILMILIININYFSTPSMARYNPVAFGNYNFWDEIVWFFEYTFVKQRFMTLLALLYGVGIILFARKYENKGQTAIAPFITRSLILVVLGMIHAYLIWDGDILVSYALCGLLVFWLRNLKVHWLIIIGALLAVGSVGLNIYYAILDIGRTGEVPDYWNPSAEAVAQALSAHQGSWWEMTPERFQTALGRQTTDFYLFTVWRCSGLMMIGMGLMKSGFIEGLKNHKTTLIWSLGIGMIVSVLGSYFYIQTDYSVFFFGTYLSLSFYIGSLLMALGYLCLMIMWAQSEVLESLKNLLEKVGRMAFTLYIMQSIICGFIFYGYGLGKYGELSRSDLMLVTFAIWAVQIVFVKVWFSYFKAGPLEWVWRKGYSLAEKK